MDSVAGHFICTDSIPQWLNQWCRSHRGNVG